MTKRYGLSLFLFLLLVFAAIPAVSQQSNSQQNQGSTVVYAKTTTARIASPDEPVNVNGTVMRVADVVAILSSNTLLELHLRTPEKQNSSDAPQIQLTPKKRSN